ncbi:MAG: hypothetical protein Q4A34_04275 [Candidatus Saccharibacteria bacterium]|nr:hypothetical protein [Candidatus Saccharibacteria bacterium]
MMGAERLSSPEDAIRWVGAFKDVTNEDERDRYAAIIVRPLRGAALRLPRHSEVLITEENSWATPDALAGVSVQVFPAWLLPRRVEGNKLQRYYPYDMLTLGEKVPDDRLLVLAAARGLYEIANDRGQQESEDCLRSKRRATKVGKKWQKQQRKYQHRIEALLEECCPEAKILREEARELMVRGKWEEADSLLARAARLQGDAYPGVLEALSLEQDKILPIKASLDPANYDATYREYRPKRRR